MEEEKLIVFTEPTSQIKTKMYMLGTKESNNERIKTNAASMICDKNKEFKFKSFAEDCFNFFSYQGREIVVKVILEYNKRQNSAKLNQRNSHLQKQISCLMHDQK